MNKTHFGSEEDQGLDSGFDHLLGFLSSSNGKESASKVGDLGLIPGSERSPAEGNGYPLQCPCLENSMDRGALRATVHGVTESDTTEQLSLLTIY